MKTTIISTKAVIRRKALNEVHALLDKLSTKKNVEIINRLKELTGYEAI